jgi:hypothetical protein
MLTSLLLRFPAIYEALRDGSRLMLPGMQLIPPNVERPLAYDGYSWTGVNTRDGVTLCITDVDNIVFLPSLDEPCFGRPIPNPPPFPESQPPIPPLTPSTPPHVPDYEPFNLDNINYLDSSFVKRNSIGFHCSTHERMVSRAARRRQFFCNKVRQHLKQPKRDC